MKRAKWLSGIVSLMVTLLSVVSAQADLTLLMRDRTNGGIANTTEAETILALEAPDGTYSFTDTSVTRDTINVSGGSFAGDLSLPNGNNDDDTYILHATANLLIPYGTDGKWTIGFGSDDGGSLKISGITFINKFNTSGTMADNEVRWETGRGHSWTFGTFEVTADLSTTLDAMMYENTGGDSYEIALFQGHADTFGATTWVLLQDGAKGWTVQVAPLVDVIPPAISALNPADEAPGVNPAQDLVATFDEEIVLTGSGTITITDTSDGSDTRILTLPDDQVTVADADLTIAPTNALEFGTSYEISISSNVVEDTWDTPNVYAGTAAGEWNFVTAAYDTTAPVLTGTVPADDEIDVVSTVNLVATFDKDIVIGTGDITIVDVTDGSGTQVIAVTNPAVSVVGATLTIDPPDDLEPDSDYAVLLDGGVVKSFSSVGNEAITNNTVWNFTMVGWWLTDTAPKLWLDADDASTITSIGGLVSQWDDKSGYERHATQGAAINQPAYTAGGLNGKDVLSFSNSYFNVDLDFLAGVAHSAFIVTKPTTSYTDIYGAANPSAGSSSLHVGFMNNTQYRMNYWGNDWYGTISANFHHGDGNILNYIWITGAPKEIYANGTSEGTGTPNAGTITIMSGGGRIGQVVNHGNYGGDIAEIIMFTGTLSAEDRQIMEGYLAHKWGLDSYLPADHPYKTVTPGGGVVTLMGSDPDDDATGVYPGGDLVANFDRPVGIIENGKISIKNLDASTQVEITLPDDQVTVNGSELIINPTSHLEFDTDYAIQVSADAVADAVVMTNVFAGINNDTNWNFTTVTYDPTPPVITNTVPADNETYVATAINLVANFDKDIYVGTGDITIVDVTDGSGTQVIAVTNPAVSIAGATLTVDPPVDFESDTVYAVRLGGGVVNTISGGDNVAITDNTTWNFTINDMAVTFIQVTNDVQSGIDGTKPYTHAIDFGSGTKATVNGVTYVGDFGIVSGSISNAGSRTYGPSINAGNTPPAVSGNVADVFSDMVLGGPDNGYVELTGLKPGKTYDFRLYDRAWDYDGAIRPATLSFDIDSDGIVDYTAPTYDQNRSYDAPVSLSSNVSWVTACKYKAGSSGKLKVSIGIGGSGTYHLYGLTNVEMPPVGTFIIMY